MRALGEWRWGVLNCMWMVYDPKSSHYFNPSPEADLRLACLDFLETVWKEEWARVEATTSSGRDMGLATTAAGLLSYGRLEMADVILDNMLPKYTTDHGCGWCNLLPMWVFDALLPLPDGICRRDRFSGEIDIEAARKWLATNRSDLRWDPDKEVFILAVPS